MLRGTVFASEILLLFKKLTGTKLLIFLCFFVLFGFKGFLYRYFCTVFLAQVILQDILLKFKGHLLDFCKVFLYRYLCTSIFYVTFLGIF